jgi:dihydrofolate reductase
MTKTQYFVAATLDGYIADQNGRLDWLLKYNDLQELGEHYTAFFSGVGALAMGATTYEWVRNELKEGWPYPGTPTWVFTHRKLQPVEGADLRFTQAEVGEVHAEMVKAANGKNVWLVGGGALVAQFVQRGLLDELHLSLMPVTLGAGAPLLPMTMLEPMELQQLTRFPRSVVELRYALTRRT